MEQISRSGSVAVSTANVQACDKVIGGWRRTQLIITNTSAAAVVTISKGLNAAVAGSGIRLPPNGAYLESTDSGFMCWQDCFQVIADAAGTIAVVETLVRD
jgi:hypothetical protein